MIVRVLDQPMALPKPARRVGHSARGGGTLADLRDRGPRPGSLRVSGANATHLQDDTGAVTAAFRADCDSTKKPPQRTEAAKSICYQSLFLDNPVAWEKSLPR